MLTIEQMIAGWCDADNRLQGADRVLITNLDTWFTQGEELNDR